jgi:hypothetical protein
MFIAINEGWLCTGEQRTYKKSIVRVVQLCLVTSYNPIGSISPPAEIILRLQLLCIQNGRPHLKLHTGS